MFKVMIADDEKIAIESLKFIIEKNFSDVEIISSARSGREAIERVEENVPDILFMDIRMPGINGIEAIREIRKRHKEIVIIVLTAFDQFEFAKEAVNLGVMEYLLKPVNRTKVVEVIEKAIELIRAEREKGQSELEMKARLESVGPMLENGFVYAIILFDDYGKELNNYKRLLAVEEDGGYVFTVEFVEELKEQTPGSKIGFEVRSQQFYPYFTQTVKALCKCILGPIMTNRIVVVVPSDEEGDEFESRMKAIAMTESLVKTLSERLDCGVKIGIGKAYNSFEQLVTSYEESLRALHYLQGAGVMHFLDILDHSDNKVGGLTRKAREYINTNYSKAITLEDIAREINVSPQYLSKLFKEETGENFIDYLTAIRIRIAKNLLEDGEHSIRDICACIGYSDPNYFSRIFKKIAGMTPTEYKDGLSFPASQ